MAAKHVTIEADIQASGALAAHLTGHAEVFERNRARGEFHGELRGQPAVLEFSSDGRSTRVRSGGGESLADIGGESNHAWLADMVRLGLWHNLKRLNELQGPDHAAGGVEGWAAFDGFRPTTIALGGDMQGAMSLGFDLVLDGVKAGSVRLWIDSVSGLPRRRQTMLRLPQGEAIVIESYQRFTLD